MDQKSKVGILSFHRCINYGSYWQTRCLIEGLSSRGYEVAVLDHDSPLIRMAEWKCALRPTLPTPVAPGDRIHYDLKIRKFVNAVSGLQLTSNFDINEKPDIDGFDLVVVGSDEVWNLAHPWYGGYPLFWGRGIREDILVSYGASFGNYDAAWGLPEEWRERLNRFRSISVRDENSRAIIRSSLGIEPVMVLDPCLQFSHEKKNTGAKVAQPYVAVYGHNFSEAFSENIIRWAHSKDYAVMSFGYRNDWADIQWMTAGPDDFVGAFENAEAVATNFFHGCVFSLLYSIPFVCESSSYRNNKIGNLLTSVGGKEHLMTEETSPSVYDRFLAEPISDRIFREINRLRTDSNEYLDAILP